MIEVKNKILYFFFQFYCLPDNYEVIDSSLDDIKVSLNFNNWNKFYAIIHTSYYWLNYSTWRVKKLFEQMQFPYQLFPFKV